MSDEHPFEVEPPGPEPGPDVAPAAPKRSSPVARRRRQARRRSRLAAEEAAPKPKGWLRRLATPLVSPTFYYLLGLLSVAGVALVLNNPYFGSVSKAWPHEMFGLGDTPFAWDGATVELIAFVLLALAYLIALCTRSGPWRATLVLVASVLAFVTFEGSPSALIYYVGPVLVAALAGALVARAFHPGRTSRVFLVALLVLGAWLFLPWNDARVKARGLSGEYQCTACATVGALVDPPAAEPAVPDPYALEADENGIPERLMENLVPVVACLLFLAGLLVLCGAGGRWAHWAAGSLLLLLWLGTALALYLQGPDGADAGGLPAWQSGLQHWAERWYWNYLAYALPLAGAVAELTRGRRD
jgi:hypothetical protein